MLRRWVRGQHKCQARGRSWKQCMGLSRAHCWWDRKACEGSRTQRRAVPGEQEAAEVGRAVGRGVGGRAPPPSEHDSPHVWVGLGMPVPGAPSWGSSPRDAACCLGTVSLAPPGHCVSHSGSQLLMHTRRKTAKLVSVGSGHYGAQGSGNGGGPGCKNPLSGKGGGVEMGPGCRACSGTKQPSHNQT